MKLQRQDSLTDQLKTVYQLAVDAGCYDAADYIKIRINEVNSKLPGNLYNEALEDAIKVVERNIESNHIEDIVKEIQNLKKG